MCHNYNNIIFSLFIYIPSASLSSEASGENGMSDKSAGGDLDRDKWSSASEKHVLQLDYAIHLRYFAL